MRRKLSSSGPVVKESGKYLRILLPQSIYPLTSAPHSLRVPPGAVSSLPCLSHCQGRLARTETRRNGLSVTSWMGRKDIVGALIRSAPPPVQWPVKSLTCMLLPLLEIYFSFSAHAPGSAHREKNRHVPTFLPSNTCSHLGKAWEGNILLLSTPSSGFPKGWRIAIMIGGKPAIT